MPNESNQLYDFYQRYLWGPVDFENFQTSIVDQLRGSLGALTSGGLLSGGAITPNGANASVNLAAFVAVGDDGYMHVKNSSSVVAIAAGDATHPRYDLIVARKDLATGLTIERPTLPNDVVTLTTLQQTELVVIAGTPAASPALPAKTANDVILGTVYVPASWVNTVSAANINQADNADTTDVLGLIGRGLGTNGIGVRGYGTGTAPGVKGFAAASSGSNGVEGTGDGTGAAIYGRATTTSGSAGGRFAANGANTAAIDIDMASGDTYGIDMRCEIGSGRAINIFHLGTGASDEGILVQMSAAGASSSAGYFANNGTGFGLRAGQGGTSGTALQIEGNNTTAAMRLQPQADPGGAHLIGHMYMTTAGVLRVCTAAGTPGTWVDVGAQ